MIKFLSFACFFIVLNYCNCGTVPLTNEEVDDGFTIVFPQQENYSLMKCYLEITKNGENKTDFGPKIDIKETNKNRDGMEYVPNYYRTGNNDSCTFRIYPNILKKKAHVNALIPMRYWNVTMNNRILEPIDNLKLKEVCDNLNSSFYMNSWSWWTEQRVNTLILFPRRTPNPYIPWDGQNPANDFEYLYVDRKVENAFTIVLPQEKEFKSLACFLKIAVNVTFPEEFDPDIGTAIHDKNKHNDGMEYAANYYNSGRNDSCTFRIYPEILNKLSNGHEKYQMRDWEITTDIMNKDGIKKRKIFHFYVDTWSSWKNRQQANTLQLEEGTLYNYAKLKFRYI